MGSAGRQAVMVTLFIAGAACLAVARAAEAGADYCNAAMDALARRYPR